MSDEAVTYASMLNYTPVEMHGLQMKLAKNGQVSALAQSLFILSILPSPTWRRVMLMTSVTSLLLMYRRWKNV